MKKILFILVAIILCGVSAQAADVTLAWDANTETDLAGYKIYYGISSRSYSPAINVGKVTQYTIKGLNDNTIYYFAAKAYDNDKNESDYSVELVHRIDTTPPASPKNLHPITVNVNVSINVDTGPGLSVVNRE